MKMILIKKIIDSIDISEGISVLSHDGYHPVTHIHKTQPIRYMS